MYKTPVPQSTNSPRAFTRLDLLASLAAAALFVAIIVPALANSNRSSDRVACLSNLRRIGVAYTHFGLEHNDLAPWHVSSRDGGNADYAGGIPGLVLINQIYVQFSVLSNFLDSPRYLADPGDPDPDLKIARFWNQHPNGGLYHLAYRNRAISYFIGLSGSFRTPRHILAGDRNVATEGNASGACANIDPTTRIRADSASWTNNIHGFSGNLLFFDGSVEQTTTPRLREALWESSVGNVCSLFPQ